MDNKKKKPTKERTTTSDKSIRKKASLRGEARRDARTNDILRGEARSEIKTLRGEARCEIKIGKLCEARAR